VSVERDLLKQTVSLSLPFLCPYSGKCLEQKREREKEISLYGSNFYIRPLYMLRRMHRTNWNESQQNDDDDDDDDDDSTMDITTGAPTSRAANITDHPLEHKRTMDTIVDGNSNTNISVDPARNIAMASSSIPLLPGAMLTSARTTQNKFVLLIQKEPPPYVYMGESFTIDPPSWLFKLLDQNIKK
jgi:hypothetical protein